MRYITLVVALYVLLASVSCATINADKTDTLVTIADAITIAQNEAVKDGYELDKMRLTVLINITPWDMHFPGAEPFKKGIYMDDQYKLDNKYYYAVKFVRKARGHDGSICYFIDAHTGEVIARR